MEGPARLSMPELNDTPNGDSPSLEASSISFRDAELMARPGDLWDQPPASEWVRDDDCDDRADLPWE